ncbi:3-deoxy-manno-octulosonate cytidylyltransferase [Pigmentibacter sp. JX0631]|uniref:3-deoxy-manno-octulosonate cytidylyltransferase n=1 Tax=Pigmentibacter sp. JX0631 TaxID=2976982 RepID=UPI002469B718|nr:3-deoxy-manno-octulosonate cytidylyltransferase [Pigmentibacter sp. JX0631]WGL60707.1 3-deoxy-manno-octulosonate cytidylyltransferase [Pigmentibacter sp. JX0631]
MTEMISKQNRIIIAIPARLGSTRLPGKPLLKIGNSSIISLVAQKANQLAIKIQNELNIPTELIVATDDQKIYTEVNQLNIKVVMTDSNLKNGTERVFVAVQSINEKMHLNSDDLIINIQGDEPFFSVNDIFELTKQMLINDSTPMGTMAFKRNELELFFSSSVVKVVKDKNSNALYFSRAPIPFPKDLLGATGSDWLNKIPQLKSNSFIFYHHVGVYAFRYFALKKFATELTTSALEADESLEQLRAMDAGWKILVTDCQHPPFGIDTPEDLRKAQNYEKK